MGGLFGGGNKGQAVTRYQYLNVQTSSQGLCIPAGWGQYRASPNLLDYVDFSARSVKQKHGKGGGGSTTSYTYSCAVILGLVEGPIQGIGQVWQDKTITTISALGFSLFKGTQTQSPWSYMTSIHPTRALAYAGTSYLANGALFLGSSPDLPNYNVEVIDKLARSMPGKLDANLGDIIPDYLTNPQYSYGFPRNSIDNASLGIFKVYQQAQGLFFSPYMNNQEQSTQTFQRWAQLANSWIFWSGNVLKFVPLGDNTLIGTNLPAVQIMDGATYQYVLEDVSGDSATETISGNNGQYQGNYTLASESYCSGVPWSTVLNAGSIGDVRLPFNNPPTGSGGSFSIEFVYQNSATGTGGPGNMLANTNACVGSISQGLSFWFPGTSYFHFSIAFTGGIINFTSSIPVTSSEPYHLVATYNGTVVAFYVNGALQGSASASGSYIPASQSIYIGCYENVYTYVGPGTYQCVAFYTVALTSSQVSSHHVALSSGTGTYIPNLTPAYNLTYDDFIFKKGADPVVVTRSDPADGYNSVTINCNDRSNAYNNTAILWQDQSSVDQYGQLMSQTISANEIQDTSVAQTCAALIGKRAVYIRNTYAFTLGYNYVLLEPGDIVTLTDPNLGMAEFPVRITNVKENKDYTLAMTAEELPFGIGTPAVYSVQQSGATTPPDVQVDPGDVNSPAIFEPNSQLSAGQAQVWIALSGGANWGGAQVFVGFDGVNYSYVGDVTLGSIQGVLAASLPATADPDTTDTLEIDLTESLSTLPATATDADADAFRTLILVDNELMAYGTAVPTSGSSNPYAFSLTYLRRGLYGTTVTSHSIGAPFTRIDTSDSSVFEYDLPEQYVDSELYLKFVSFNIFGNGYQDISDVTEYTYTPVGTGYYIAPPGTPTASPSSVTQSDGTTLITMNISWTSSIGPNLGSYNLKYSTNGGSTYTTVPSIPGSTNSYQLSPALASTSYLFSVQAVSLNGQALSTWETSSAVNSGALVTTPIAPTAIAATAILGGAQVTWTPSTDNSTTGYQVSYSTTDTFSSSTLWPNTTSGTGLQVTGLTSGTLYYFWVQSINPAGASSPDGSASATPAATGTSSGDAGQLAWYSASGASVAGNVNVTYSGGALTIGVLGTQAGSVKLVGGTSGAITLSTPVVAGSSTLVLPTGTGTNGQAIVTDGTGILSFATISGGGGGGGGISFQVLGLLSASETVLIYPVGSAGLTLDAGLPGWSGYADTAPTVNPVTITLYKNGTSIGSINWAVGATAPTLTFSAAVTFVNGDVLTGTSQTTTNATFANFGVVLVPLSNGGEGGGAVYKNNVNGTLAFPNNPTLTACPNFVSVTIPASSVDRVFEVSSGCAIDAAYSGYLWVGAILDPGSSARGPDGFSGFPPGYPLQVEISGLVGSTSYGGNASFAGHWFTIPGDGNPHVLAVTGGQYGSGSGSTQSTFISMVARQIS